MTLTAERISLSREVVKGIIDGWAESGLPDVRIQFHATVPNQVYLQVPDINSLFVWAGALGIDIDLDCFGGSWSRYTHWCEPDALPGWRLSVYCDCPVIPQALRIPCGGGEPR